MWCRHHAVRDTVYHPDCTTGNWVYQQDKVDIVTLVDFAVSQGISNSGVEEMVKLFQELGGGKSARISKLPSSWRTTEKLTMEGCDKNSLVTHERQVPADLGFSFKTVPRVLKTFKSYLCEMLLDVETTNQGSFHFGTPPRAESGKYVTK